MMWLVAEFAPRSGPKAMWVFGSEHEARGRYLHRAMREDCTSVVLAGPFPVGSDVLDFVGRIIEHHERPQEYSGNSSF